MKIATKPLTLHRRAIALLTTVLLLAACVIVSQQRDNERLRAQRDSAIYSTADYKKLFEDEQQTRKQLQQVNTHLTREYFRMMPKEELAQMRQTDCGLARQWIDENTR